MQSKGTLTTLSRTESGVVVHEWAKRKIIEAVVDRAVSSIVSFNPKKAAKRAIEAAIEAEQGLQEWQDERARSESDSE